MREQGSGNKLARSKIFRDAHTPCTESLSFCHPSSGRIGTNEMVNAWQQLDYIAANAGLENAILIRIGKKSKMALCRMGLVCRSFPEEQKSSSDSSNKEQNHFRRTSFCVNYQKLLRRLARFMVIFRNLSFWVNSTSPLYYDLKAWSIPTIYLPIAQPVITIRTLSSCSPFRNQLVYFNIGMMEGAYCEVWVRPTGVVATIEAKQKRSNNAFPLLL